MLIGNGTLVLVADGRKLLVFRNEGDVKYPVLATILHEEDENPPTREQGTDAPGRAFSSIDARRSGYGETDLHQLAEDRFAIAAAATLDGVADRHDGNIVVIAPPQTLGELRKHYGAQVRKRLIAEIDKDLTGHVTDDIAQAIAAHGP